MKAGNGVWHDGGAIEGDALRVFQLWIALPASEENAPPESQYVTPQAVQEDGPVRVILGRYGRANSVIGAPQGVNYFHVRLSDGQQWRYVPTTGHTVAWLAEQGILVAPGEFYGAKGARHVRVAFTATDERIAAAVARLSASLSTQRLIAGT